MDRKTNGQKDKKKWHVELDTSAKNNDNKSS